MLRNFFSAITRFALASSLNVVGLSVAFAAAIVILIEVNYQMSFDRTIADNERIYRIGATWQGMDMVPTCPGSINYVGSSCSSVESSVALQPAFGNSYITVTRAGAKVGFDEPVWLATDGFAKVFSLQMIEGSGALSVDDNMILPRSVAERYFGRTINVVGEKVEINSAGVDKSYVVSGVFEDMPSNCQIKNTPYTKADLYLFNSGDWSASNHILYAKLNKGATFEQFSAEVATLKVQGVIEKLTVVPYTDIYFNEKSYFGDEMFVTKGNRTTVDVLLAIALLVILIAGINFVNFATSLAPIRMRSINTQKVFGCPTSRLRAQLIIEAIGISIVAFFVALVLVSLLGISSLSNLSSGVISVESNWLIVGQMAVVAVLVGLFAGLYPAYYTTKFPPALVLKGSFANSKNGRILRTSLVCVQFVISITLIIATLFLQRQNNFLKSKDTGLETEHIAVVRMGGRLLDNQSTAFTERVRTKTGIVDVAYSQFSVGRDNLLQYTQRNIKGEDRKFGMLLASHNFADVMGIQITGGRSATTSDTSKNIVYSMIFNESAASQFGIEAGQLISEWNGINSDVVGICSDFNFQTLRNGVEPMAIVTLSGYAKQNLGILEAMPIAYVKFTGDPASAIEAIQSTAAQIDPAYPISVSFFGEMFEQMYQTDIKTTRLVTLFSIIAILISLVGVFGMVVFETQYRRREIGVRRVHGATIGSILLMFNRKFIYIVAACSVVAVPVAAWGVSLWLDGFAYRTTLVWWLFAVGVVVIALITVLTVTTQSYRAATENPVNSLKAN